MLSLLILAARLGVSVCSMGPDSIESAVTGAVCGDESTEDCTGLVDAAWAAQHVLCSHDPEAIRARLSAGDNHGTIKL